MGKRKWKRILRNYKKREGRGGVLKANSPPVSVERGRDPKKLRKHNLGGGGGGGGKRGE